MGRSIIFLLLAALTTSAVADEERVFSGPQPGEKLMPFKFRNVLASPERDEDVVTQAAGKPLLLIFVHKRTRPAFGLANALMQYAQTRNKDGLNSACVYLTSDATASGNWMKSIRQYFDPKAIYGISMDGEEGPGAYGLNREVTLTVLVGKRDLVSANFALVQPSMEADGPRIAAALVDTIGSGKVPDLTKFGGYGRRTDQKKMERKAPVSGEMDPQLTALLRQVINREATVEDVNKAAAELEKYIEKKADLKKRVGEIASRIVAADKLTNYGTQRAQEHISRWAKEYGPTEQNSLPASKKKPDAEKKPVDKKPEPKDDKSADPNSDS